MQIAMVRPPPSEPPSVCPQLNTPQVSMFFAFFNGYSGLGFYATLLDMFFNAAWTSWPVLLSTPQDRIIEKKTIYANPTGTHPPSCLSALY